ncbi:hypothetical protein DCS_05760 [Drechmeria coniospora]|uniref:Chromo domain-containing protein n=1 Tax=Drechmeria coniospora TaxID=98403 RepID=A0A151GNQ4_DRECN|nr:hypothetical protein DCS_05760 [Drechmeria coniospora]KYK58743.1 hypothetical protein DCS_05760 [Drechmeria coniospora]
MPRPRRRWTQVKSRSRKPKAAQDDGWFSIRGILDERPVEGGVEYLVDWDDNPNTGDAYDPTWSREVTDEAREEWEREKASTARRGAPEGDGQPALLDGCWQNGPRRLLNQSPTPTADAGPPILSRSPGSEDLNDRPRKVARLRRSDASSEEPVPSIASLPSVDPVATPVIGNQSLPLDVGTDSCLKIPLDDEESPIDETECLGAASTQSSHLSSLSVAEQEAQDDIVTFSSQISRRTIPDSQEPSGQSWSNSGPSPTSSQPLACSQEALVGGSDESQSRQVVADIPSRQPAADSESLRVEGRNLTTATASDSDTIRSPGQIDQPSAPASSNEPIFQTQPPTGRVSSIPESASESRASNHTSPSEIRATPTDPFADSILLSRVEAEPPDAQIVRRHDFDPLRDILMMESHSADAAPSEPQISASDELSQLLNLGPTLPGPDSPPSQVEGHGLFDGAAASMSMAPTASPPSAAEALQRIVDDAFAPSNVAPPESRISIEPRHAEQLTVSPAEQPTVSPADITHQDGQRKGPLILLQSPLHHDLILSGFPGASAGPVSMAQPHAARAPSEASVRSASGPAELEHVVTLPFQASLRPLYDETLLGDKRAVTEFGRIFNSKVSLAPDEALVKKIDHLFSRLHNICDYPQHVVATSLEALPPMQMAKYSCDANPKFNFLYELLQSIKRNTKMLIVARSVELLRLIYTLTEALEVDCVCDAVGKSKSSFTNSVASVRLILPDVDVGAFDADVVIGFDHSFASSRARSIYSDDDRTYSPGPSLAPEGRRVGRPLVLILATIHSIEHIDLSVPADLGRLERKNALLAGIVHARKLMSDPDRGYLEPHEVARCFAEYINGEVEDVAWKPVAVPDEVLDVYDGSQTRPHMTIAASPDVDKGRKRKLVSHGYAGVFHSDADFPQQDDVQDEDAKKIRLLQIQESTVETNEPPLSDDIQEMLQRFMPQESAENPMQARTKVPVVMLQALTEKASSSSSVMGQRLTVPACRTRTPAGGQGCRGGIQSGHCRTRDTHQGIRRKHGKDLQGSPPSSRRPVAFRIGLQKIAGHARIRQGPWAAGQGESRREDCRARGYRCPVDGGRERLGRGNTACQIGAAPQGGRGQGPDASEAAGERAERGVVFAKHVPGGVHLGHDDESGEQRAQANVGGSREEIFGQPRAGAPDPGRERERPAVGADPPDEAVDRGPRGRAGPCARGLAPAPKRPEGDSPEQRAA